MRDIIVAIFILLGSGFVLVSALGLLRMPDIYMRMHAATKAGTLGTGLMLVALAVFFGDLGGVVEASTVFIFLLLTAPVAAHVIGRAAYLSGVKLWERTQMDEFAEYCEEMKEEERGKQGARSKKQEARRKVKGRS